MKTKTLKQIAVTLAAGLTAAITLSAPSSALAREENSERNHRINERYIFEVHSNCVTEYITKLSESQRQTQSCHLSVPMRLAWAVQNYPLLNDNPRRVQFWQGEHAKEIAIDSVYLRELVDTCRGHIISRREITETQKQVLRFPLLNVNLSTDIKESFMLVPMTEIEARQQLAEAANTCEAN